MNYADNFSKFFEKVKELMPSLRNVRLHLDNTEPIHADQFHYEKFNELVELPNVKAIVLEIGCLYSDHFNKYGTKSELRELAEAIRARLVKTLTERAVKLGKVVQITATEIAERDAELVSEEDSARPDNWI